MLHIKTISSNYNQNTNKKTDENREKTTKIGIAYVNFIKQIYIEVDRGVEYMNYQREAAILTDFCQKDGQ